MSTIAKAIDADVLIIGSGLAGLLTALKLGGETDKTIVLASKGTLMDSNSSYAQGGLAAVTESNPFDSLEAHLNDTIKSGAGLADYQAAQGIIYGGSALVEELSRHGVHWDKNGHGGFSLHLEGGHCQSRVLHNKDATGRAITSALSAKLRHLAATRKNLTLMENVCARELLLTDGSCIGAELIAADSIITVCAPYTVLCTGGVGQVFQRSTNPEIATGDGIALAYRAGARLMDMEFMQFHPTALCLEGKPAFLISEAVRGAGAILVDHTGKRFMQRFHTDGELATRDVVARAIQQVMLEHALPHIFLDLRPIGVDSIQTKFPMIYETCASYGINILEEPIPIAPAAHYFMGGIEATVEGTTSVPGLYALGECASTGLHGANRLASNSLLEAGVMAIRFADHVKDAPKDSAAVNRKIASYPDAPSVLPEDISKFRTLMYMHAGLIRSQTGLQGILQASEFTAQKPLSASELGARNIFQVGKLIAQAALLRRESRGSHFRSDFSTVDNDFAHRRLWLSKTGYGWTSPSEKPVTIYRQAAQLQA